MPLPSRRVAAVCLRSRKRITAVQVPSPPPSPDQQIGWSGLFFTAPGYPPVALQDPELPLVALCVVRRRDGQSQGQSRAAFGMWLEGGGKAHLAHAGGRGPRPARQ